MKKSLILETLTLKNFATFSDQSIVFESGLNALIGETGSGKSLILDALNLIFGSRADKKLIRKNSEFSVVEASFSISDSSIKEFFFNVGLPYEDDVIIKRVLYSNGKSKSYVNFQQCSLSTLNELSKRYIDLVGQFENQKLFSETYQLKLLDNYGQNSKELKNYKNLYESYLQAKVELENLAQKRSNILQHKDFVSFQVSELEKLSPSVDEEKDLLKQKEAFQSIENNNEVLSKVNALFEGDENTNGLLNLSSILEKCLLSDAYVSDELKSKVEELSQLIRDLSFDVNKELTAEDLDIDIDEVISRLDLYTKLQRKYDTDTVGLIRTLSELQDEKSDLDGIDQKIKTLKQELDSQVTKLFELSKNLHKMRLNASKKLSLEITSKVQSLNMKGATLTFELYESEQLGPSGTTRVTFKAQTNPGEGFYKVKDIASGGELSRILLALKQAISTKDSVSIFLFDEIDTGMGGETAFKIGETLKKVSASSQVIAITHLAQIAQFSNLLIKVEKKVNSKEKRTYSSVKLIKENKIKSEVESMTPLI